MSAIRSGIIPRGRRHVKRRRHRGEVPTSLTARRPRAETIYECPGCGERMTGEQRCEECNLFCRSLGPGGECPCCSKPVAISDLIEMAS